MPNWCDNEVDITGDAEELKRFMAEASKPHPLHEEVVFLMDNLVPMPEELRDTQAPQDNPNWYNWRLANWGTKWDLGQENGETQVYYEEGDTEAGLSYLTAWSPNQDFWANVSERFPKLTIDLRYVEEGMWFMGQVIYEGGDIVAEIYHNDIPDEIAIKAGAVLTEDGEIDWENSELHFWEVFPLIKKELV
mgnify:CR=1 FL=1|jgi:hypothetical protein